MASIKLTVKRLQETVIEVFVRQAPQVGDNILVDGKPYEVLRVMYPLVEGQTTQQVFAFV